MGGLGHCDRRARGRLDANSAEAQHAVGRGYEVKGKLSLALQYYKRAIALNPNYSPALSSIGWVAFGLGNVDEALGWMKKSVVLAPDNAAQYVNVGVMFTALDEDTLAVRWFHKASELQNDLVSPHWYLAYLYLTAGEDSLARAEVSQSLGTSPDDVFLLHAAGDVEMKSGNFSLARQMYEKAIRLSSWAEGPGTQLAYLLMKSGKVREAERILDSNLVVHERNSREEEEDFNYPLAVANIHAIKGHRDEATRWLAVAVARGLRDYRWLAADPVLESLRGDNRFQQLMIDLRRRVETMRQRARQQGLLD